MGTEIIMLGALVLGGAIFLKVLPNLQSAAAAGGAGAGAGGAGTWAQNPASTTPCGMIGTACPTIGATSPDTWCTCTASAAAAPGAGNADDPCSRVTSKCIANGSGGCFRQGNSACSCTGCSQTHASSTANKAGSTSSKSSPSSVRPAVPGGGSGTVAEGHAAAQRLAALDPVPAREAPARKICPPLVKC